MITNHGIHQWQVVPGLPDTGGQNVFVNQFTAALVKLGFRITIINRGVCPGDRPVAAWIALSGRTPACSLSQ
jgi:hypothetical protein